MAVAPRCKRAVESRLKTVDKIDYWDQQTYGKCCDECRGVLYDAHIRIAARHVDVGKRAREAHGELIRAASAVPWPRFDLCTLATTQHLLGNALKSDNNETARYTEIALAYGKVEAFWELFASDYPGFELCHVWDILCSNYQRDPECEYSQQVEACMASAFVRVGMPLHAPFLILNTDPSTPSPQPFTVAAYRCEPLAHALLDLPIGCGLDVTQLVDVAMPPPVRMHFCSTIKRVREHRRELTVRVSKALKSCGVTVSWLHAIVSGYAQAPVYNEMQLNIDDDALVSDVDSMRHAMFRLE